MIVADLIASGSCSPGCLCAARDADTCDCRCGGDYHGALLDADVKAVERPGTARCVACGSAIPRTQRYVYLWDRTSYLCNPCIHDEQRFAAHQVLLAGECDLRWHDLWDHGNRMLGGPRRVIDAYLTRNAT